MTSFSRLALLAASLFAVGASPTASAATLTEDFNAPFPAWESAWFGTLSDAHNYCEFSYCVNDNWIPMPPSVENRGRNPDGLWLVGPSGYSSAPITITFDSGFGASLVSFKIDVAGYVETTLSAWDKNGAQIFAAPVELTYGATSAPGVYSSYTITSTNGIGGFAFSGPAAGNTSIDNLIAVTSAVPEPASAALLLGGLALAALGARRKPG